MAEKIRFSKPTLQRLPAAPEGARVMYADDSLPGLYLRVSPAGRKSFLVYAKAKGKPRPVKVTLGAFPNMTIEQAQRRAKGELSRLAEGINPNEVRKAERASSVTLEDAFEAYLKTRGDKLKASTVADYRKVLTRSFKDWQKNALASITRDMVAARHRKLGESSQAQANYAMRLLRAIFNFAAGVYEDKSGRSLFPDNPVTRISHTRAWYRVERRKTVIKNHELKPWFTAVLAMQSKEPTECAEVYRDYFITALLTGLRRDEAARLLRKDVDLKAKTLTVYDTKNREAHTLPLSDYLVKLLRARVEVENEEEASPYVFPSPTSNSGQLIAVQKQVEKIRKASGVQFSMHDLRRTFITTAESVDISAYAVKRLANHKMRDDVTAGYIITDVERLRKPMQAITDFILKSAGIKQGATVTRLKAKARPS